MFHTLAIVLSFLELENLPKDTAFRPQRAENVVEGPRGDVSMPLPMLIVFCFM